MLAIAQHQQMVSGCVCVYVFLKKSNAWNADDGFLFFQCSADPSSFDLCYIGLWVPYLEERRCCSISHVHMYIAVRMYVLDCIRLYG